MHGLTGKFGPNASGTENDRYLEPSVEQIGASGLATPTLESSQLFGGDGRLKRPLSNVLFALDMCDNVIKA